MGEVILGAGVAIGALLPNLVSSLLRARDLRLQLASERALTADLHSRLASRTYAEYAAFNGEPLPPAPARNFMRDDTGLIEWDDGSDDRLS